LRCTANVARMERAKAWICWGLATVAALFAVVRLFGFERGWYASVVMAFTPYLILLVVLPLILALVLRRWAAAAVTMVVAIALVSTLVPRAVGHPDPGKGPELRVMSQNLKLGGAKSADVVALVRSHRIDLLALEEFTPIAQTEMEADGLSDLLPYHAAEPFPGATGSAIYSRYPLSDTGYQHLAGGFGQEYATVAVPGALPLQFYAVHTRAPTMPAVQAEWARSLEQTPGATPHGTVRLMAGDFNATLDQWRLRRLLDTGYVDVASQLGDGLVTTWPYDGRLIPPVPITLDHVFADPRIGAVSFSATAVHGTDHRAIFAVVTLPTA
jgi:endonuclease/exonuclease/phosphatase (EEP) superfamily protein YafD